MGNVVRGINDTAVDRIVGALAPYKARHPDAVVEAYRRDPFTIYARIVDPDFDGLDWVERHNLIWGLLKAEPADILWQMGLLVLVTPDEMADSGSSLEFDDPLPYP